MEIQEAEYDDLSVLAAAASGDFARLQVIYNLALHCGDYETAWNCALFIDDVNMMHYTIFHNQGLVSGGDTDFVAMQLDDDDGGDTDVDFDAVVPMNIDGDDAGGDK